MKKFGFGLMRLPLLDENVLSSIDKEQVKVMVDRFIESGFTYFDTAWMYCGHESERAIKECLVDRYARNAYTLTTKLHNAFFDRPEQKDEIFQTQLEKTGLTYFDYYLVHDIHESSYQKYEDLDAFNWIFDKKEKGLVKHVGFSFHGKADLLDHILTKYPDFEFVQLQINYLDWDDENIQSRKNYEVACKHNKPVIVMEPVKGGTLSVVTDDIKALFDAYNPDVSVSSWALRFAASLDNVVTVLSGMSNIAQMEDNLKTMSSFKPLNEEEYKVIEEVVKLMKSKDHIACTKCAYCTEGCPMKIAIPRLFNSYNMQQFTGNQKGRYEKILLSSGKPSECIECGQCESICPQHLPIISLLKKVDQCFQS